MKNNSDKSATGQCLQPYKYNGKELDLMHGLNTYDFDMHNPWNPMNWGRNIETLIGKKIAGKGNPYTIHIYGSKKLTPIFPWIK